MKIRIDLRRTDIVVRPYFEDGQLRGFFARYANNMNEDPNYASPSELYPTPKEAVAAIVEDYWSPLAARAFGDHWIESQHPYNAEGQLPELMAAITEAFPEFEDVADSIARECDRNFRLT